MSGRTTRDFGEAEYRVLLADFLPRPIRNEEQLSAAEARIEQLLALHERTLAQDEYLDLQSGLVEAWEDANVEIPPVSGVVLAA